MEKWLYHLTVFTGTNFMITHTGDNEELVEDYARSLSYKHDDIRLYGEFYPSVFTFIKNIKAPAPETEPGR